MVVRLWNRKNETESKNEEIDGGTAKPRVREDIPKRVRNTAQSAIWYEGLTESGICALGRNRYSITLRLGDVNYQIASEQTQEALIEQYAMWINTFDSSQSLQISVVNRVLDNSSVRTAAEMALRGDTYDQLRIEYNGVVDFRLSRGRNNTVTDKYATITIETSDFDEARTRLMRVATESVAYLRNVGGCKAEIMTGIQRADILYGILHPNTPFHFDYDELADLGMSTKDALSPWSFDFSDKSKFVIGNEIDTESQVLFLDRLPPWLSDQVVRALTEINTDLVVSIHARPIDPGEGLTMVNRRIADMDIQQVNEQRKARKQGYSMDLVPHSLRKAHEEANELRSELETSNQKLFSNTVVVMVSGPSADELKHRVERVREAGRRFSCEFTVTKYMQKEGMNAALPLGRCDLPLFRTMTTATTAVMVPFTTQEIFQPHGINYGVNKLSGNLLLGARQSGMNGNAFYLGTSGSGKSMFGKSELAQVLLTKPEDDVIIIDPELDYLPVVEAFGGARIEIHAGSSQSINPMELHPDPEEEHPIRRKAEFVLSMCEVLIGGINGLTAGQRSLIDRAATKIFTTYLQKRPGRRGEQPTLLSLFEELEAQPEEESTALARDLELYARGSFSGFARESNIDQKNRLRLYDISKLGSDMRTFGMLVVLEEVWGRIARNRAEGRRTWLYVDEFHVMFANQFAAQYFQSIYKRARKYGVMTTGLTQNISELLANHEAKLMLANSDMLALLGQTEADAAALQQLFGFSQQERSYFVNVPPGNGLLKLGPIVVPFDNTLPDNGELFRLFSSRFVERVL